MRHVVAGLTVLVQRRGRVVARIDRLPCAGNDGTPDSAASVSLTDIRGRAGCVLDRVVGGEKVNIVRRGHVVAGLRACDDPAKVVKPRRIPGVWLGRQDVQRRNAR